MKTDRKTVRTASRVKAGKTKSRIVSKSSSMQTGNILERVSDGFVAFDAQMNYTYVNKRGGEMLGRKPEDLVGKNYWVEYPEAKGSTFADAYTRALKEQAPLLIEDYYEPFDRWFENRIYPSRDGLVVFFTDITERKKAEQAVRESERRFREMLEDIQLIAVLLDMGGRVTFCNEYLLQLSGYAREEVIGCDWFAQFVPDVRPDVKETFLQGLERGELNPHYENPIRTKSGEERLIRFSNTILLDGQGKIIGTTSIGEDITERRLAEEALRESEQRYRLLFHRSPIGVVQYDQNLRVIDCNQWFVQILHTSREKVIGLDIRNLRDQGGLPAFQKSLAGEEGFAEDLYQATTSDVRVWLTTRTAPLFDPAGGVCGGVAIIEDITERKMAVEKIQESQRRLSTLIGNLPGLAYRCRNNANFTTEFISDGVENITGYPAADFREHRREFGQLIHPGDQEQVAEEIQAALKENRPFELTYRILPATGEQKWVWERGMGIRNASGEVEALEGFVTDITDRKRAEEKLQRHEQVLRLFVEHSPAAIAMFDRDMKYIVASRRYLIDYELGEQNVVGRSHYEIFPEMPERWKEIHRRCLAGAVEKADEDSFPRASGKTDWVRWEILPWYERTGEIGGIILFSEVITDRKHAEEDLKKRYKELGAIYESAQHLQKLLSPDTLAREVIEVLEAALSYTFGAVLLVDEAAGTLEPFALSSQKQGAEFTQADREYIRSKGLRLGVGVTGWVAEHGESLRLGDVRRDERYYDLRNNINSELCVPMRIQDRVIGVVNVESTQPDAYSEDDQRVLETIAVQIAVAIQNTRLLDELRLHRDRLAELSRKLVETHETESRAIGRELHDQVGQMLTALKLTLDIASQLPAEQSAKKLAGAQELLDDLMNRVSRLSLELRPPMLDDLGLIPALLWHVNRFQEQSGIEIEFTHGGVEGRRFDAEIETTAYRLVQEALTNVARHARATRTRLEVQVRGGRMEIQIEDNGVGFDPQSALAKNRGLGGMRERVHLLGGTFQIESQPGQGAKESIQLPLREEIK